MRNVPGNVDDVSDSVDYLVSQVKEETGFDASAKANEKDSLSLYLNGQQTTLYIIPGVDESFPFEPQVGRLIVDDEVRKQDSRERAERLRGYPGCCLTGWRVFHAHARPFVPNIL